ncbi:aminotransferase class III-fold pyridoxal phosphate-dependent enzyme [Cupriavidus basilensis]
MPGHYDAAPDLTTMAKSLAGGMPLSAVCRRAEIMDAPAPGGPRWHLCRQPAGGGVGAGGTGRAGSEKLIERGAALGRRLQDKLEEA